MWIVAAGIGLAVLLFAFPRQAAVVAIVFVGLGGAIWAYLSWQSDNAAKNRAAFVGKVSLAECTDPKFPLYVSFSNGTGHPVTDTHFSVSGNYPGHSYPAITQYLDWDKIIAPGATEGSCWASFDLGYKKISPAELEWTVAVSRITSG